MISRLLSLPNHSFFLFGPRGVGKTTFLRSWLPPEETVVLDLFNFETETRFRKEPGAFAHFLSTLSKNITWVMLDEIQRFPALLNEVHRHIESHRYRRFAITGSSARKLRRGEANLLAGRAFVYHFFPLSSVELKDAFQLDAALAFGTLPKLFSLTSDQEKKEFLNAYAKTYLQEEVFSESLVRQLDGFRQFLIVAAVQNGEIISFSNIAREVGLSAPTIQGYFQILEDTLIGFLLPAYRRSIRKRQKTHPKFYFFDPGVKRALAYELDIPLHPSTSEYGKAFEHFWILEIMRLSSYRRSDWRFSYFATHESEIDLVIERPAKPLLFVEIKSSKDVKGSDLRPIVSLVRDVKDAQGLVICREPFARKIGNVLVCPWQEAMKRLQLM